MKKKHKIWVMLSLIMFVLSTPTSAYTTLHEMELIEPINVQVFDVDPSIKLYRFRNEVFDVKRYVSERTCDGEICLTHFCYKGLFAEGCIDEATFFAGPQIVLPDRLSVKGASSLFCKIGGNKNCVAVYYNPAEILNIEQNASY